jgi:hypothetical protein
MSNKKHSKKKPSKNRYNLPALPLMVRNFLSTRSVKWISTFLIILSFYPCDDKPWEALFNQTFLCIFSIEILLRFISYIFIDIKDSSARRGELLYLVIDVIALASFLPSNVLSLETRYLRLFRLIRLFKLLRNFSGTFHEIKLIIKAKSLSRQLRILVMTIIIIAFIGSFVHILYVPDTNGRVPGITVNNIFKGAWWCIRQMADPGNMASFPEVRNFQHGLLSFSLMVTGVLVLSFIIGIGSEVIRSLIEMTRNKPIEAVRHYLLCGWDPQSSVLVKQLFSYLYDNDDTESFRFAVLEDKDQERNVLLSLGSKASKSRLSKAADACARAGNMEIDFEKELIDGKNFFIRTGSAGNNTDLDLVSAGTSRAIVILPETSESRDPEVIAKVLNVCAYIDNYCTPAQLQRLSLLYPDLTFSRPSVIAVTQDPESCELAVTAGADIAVSKFDFTSKFLSQLILNPWIVDIFKELFSWEGSEIYTLDLSEIMSENAGRIIDLPALAQSFLDNGMILLGIVRRRLKPVFRKSGHAENITYDDLDNDSIYERDMQFLSSMDYSSYSLLDHKDLLSDKMRKNTDSRTRINYEQTSSACVVVELVYLAANQAKSTVRTALNSSLLSQDTEEENRRLSVFSSRIKHTMSEEERLIRDALSKDSDQVSFIVNREKEPKGEKKSVLILGWNKGVPSLITHLKSFLKNLEVTILIDEELTPQFEAECLNMIRRAARKKSLSIFGKTIRKMGNTDCHSEKCRQIFAHATSGIPLIKFIKADYTSATDMVLAPDLDIKRQDYIILIPEFENTTNPDGRVFLGILNLMTLADQGFIKFKKSLRIIAEIADVNQGSLMDRIVEQYQKVHELRSHGSDDPGKKFESNSERDAGKSSKRGAGENSKNSVDMIESRKRDWLNIVPSENFFNRFMASILFNPQQKRIFDRLFTDKDEEIYILKPGSDKIRPFDFMDVKKGDSFQKFYLGLIHYSIILIGIVSSEDGSVIINPAMDDQDYKLNENDHFVVICNKNNPIKKEYSLFE